METLAAAVNASPTGVTVGDLPVFRIAVTMQARFEKEKARSDVDNLGRPIVSIAALSGLARTVAGLLAKFRLDPASRGAVTVTLEPEPDPHDPDELSPLPQARDAAGDVQ
jgi:hypothetical protein